MQIGLHLMKLETEVSKAIKTEYLNQVSFTIFAVFRFSRKEGKTCMFLFFTFYCTTLEDNS